MNENKNDKNDDDLSKKIDIILGKEAGLKRPDPPPDRKISEADIWRACCAQQDGDAWLANWLFRDRFCFDHAAVRWYQWSGHFWAEDKIDNVIRRLDEVIDTYAREAATWGLKKIETIRNGEMRDADKFEEKEKAYLKKIAQLQKKRWKDDVLKLAASGEHSLGNSGDTWDLDPWSVPCVNGVIELKNGGEK
jgi:putative DNA primase/helicase